MLQSGKRHILQAYKGNHNDHKNVASRYQTDCESPTLLTALSLVLISSAYSVSYNSCEQYLSIFSRTSADLFPSTWLSWFPLLFYTTLYIGDLHKRAYYTSLLVTETVGPSSVGMIGGSIGSLQILDEDALEDEANRLGSRALFMSAVVSLLGNFILPFFVIETKKKNAAPSSAHDLYDANGAQNGIEGYSQSPNRAWTWQSRSWGIPDVCKVHLASLWASSHVVFAACMLGTL